MQPKKRLLYRRGEMKFVIKFSAREFTLSGGCQVIARTRNVCTVYGTGVRSLLENCAFMLFQTILVYFR